MEVDSSKQLSEQKQTPQKTEEDEVLKNIRLQNELGREKAVDSLASINTPEYKVPYNPDGSISFYWFDAHEENNGADIYLFGKVWQPEIKQFVSCALKVKGM